jgi:hypothetical protein
MFDGPFEAVYVRGSTPDERGRVVYTVLSEGEPFADRYSRKRGRNRG